MNSEKFMTLEQVQQYLNLGKRTVYRKIKNGEIPCTRVGGVWRFNKNKIDEWLAENTNPVTFKRSMKTKVLIVDDDPGILEILTLSIDGNLPESEVHTELDGISAMLSIGTIKPDVLILDINLPGMDGLEVCDKIKKNPETQDIVIVAMSGYKERGYKESALKKGADAFFEKPFDPMHLVTVIKEKIVE